MLEVLFISCFMPRQLFVYYNVPREQGWDTTLTHCNLYSPVQIRAEYALGHHTRCTDNSFESVSTQVIISSISHQGISKIGKGMEGALSLSIHAFIAVSWAFCLLWFCMTQESLSDSSTVTPSAGQRQEAHSSLGVPSCSTFKVRVPLSDPYFSFLEKRIG